MTIGIRANGEFCWTNMLTPDPDRARAFFHAVLGWTYTEIPGVGHMVRTGGVDVGGIFDLDGPGTPKGSRAHIGVMVKVENADATVERVIALGGAARPAFDIGERLRMAVCTDAVGASFDVWEPKASSGTEVDTRGPGAPSWFEILTPDLGRARAFYTDLFGWVPRVAQSSGHEYTTFSLDGADVAGMMQITAEMGKLKPHWGVYFAVMDVDESARTATALGADLCVPPRDIPGIGRFCGIVSPQGVVFYTISHSG